MRARNLKPGFFRNDQLAECDPLARLLFQGLWCLADRDGRLECRPKKIKAEVLPFDNCDAEELLAQLADAELIRIYEVEGKSFIWIPEFLRHQKPHPNEKSLQLPEFTETREKVRSDREKVRSDPASSLNPSSLNPSSLNPESPTEPPAPPDLRPKASASGLNGTTKAEVLGVFEHWKNRMNHQRAGLDAKREKQIQAALRLGYTAEDLCECVDGYAESPHHMGQNERGTVYDSIGLLFRDADHIDAGIKMARCPPRPMSEGDRRMAGNMRAAMEFLED